MGGKWQEILRRWQVVPTWVKITAVVLLLAVLSGVHLRLYYTHQLELAGVVQRLFFIPLFMASLLFGLKGGLACAALISLNYWPVLTGPHPGGWNALLGDILEVGLYFLAGGITGIIVDRERREARKLKEAENLALLGQATAAVAHELKNPLIAIGGFAQRIYRDLPEDHPHKKRLKIIVDQAKHMENLLREMLDYSRPVSLNLRRHEIKELVEEVVSLSKLLAEEAGVELVTEFTPAPVEVVADGGRIKQVLLNLVHNAIQASPPGAQVKIVVRKEGGDAIVEVIDEGPGIPPEEMEKIFCPFYTTKHQGTGLGLAISRKIVIAHGGRLEVDSTPGQGSTFRLRLSATGALRAA